MPEKIVPRADTTASRFIRQATGKAVDGKLWVNVQLLVDGVEVPFTATLAVMEEEFKQALEEEAKAKAVNIIMAADLGEAIDTLRKAHLGVKRVIRMVRDKAPDPDDVHVERV